MSRNSKKRRDTKKKIKSQNLKKNWSAGGNLAVIAPTFTRVSNPFEGMSEDQRAQAFVHIRNGAQEKYQNALNDILRICTTHNPLAILSNLVFYGLTAGVGDDGVSKNDSDSIVHQFQIELLQGIALKINQASRANLPFDNGVFQETIDALKNLSNAKSVMEFSEDHAIDGDEQKAINLVRQVIKGNTQAVRNWGYSAQIRNISKEIYAEFDAIVKDKYGFTCTNVISIFEHLISKLEKVVNERMDFYKSLANLQDRSKILEAYAARLNIPVSEVPDFGDFSNEEEFSAISIIFILMAHDDLSLYEKFKFSPNEIAQELGVDHLQVKTIFNNFSLSLDQTIETDTEEIFLSNPVWTRPIIKLNDQVYFCAIPQTFFSFVIPSLENFVSKIDSARLSKSRSVYLENKIEEIICRRFPQSKTVSGLEWKKEGRLYETDLITFIDSHAVIVEAKSGKITESALKGAPGRIKKHITQLFIDPSIQSARFKDHLESLIKDPSLDPELVKKIPIDLQSIRKIIRISVSLEDFGSLQSNLTDLKDTGWFPDGFTPCPTFNLADFETIFDFLEHPVQILHYFEARHNIENLLNFRGDELDLLGLYISTLFNLGSVGKDTHLSISGMSSEIDRYYMSREIGVHIDKPQPKISKLFKDIFSQLEVRKPPRWTEIGVILNYFSPDDQVGMEGRLCDLRKNVLQNWKGSGHLNSVVCIPPKNSQFALCYVMYREEDKNNRDDYVKNGVAKSLEHKHVRYCLVVAKNIDSEELAYDKIGLFLRSEA